MIWTQIVDQWAGGAGERRSTGGMKKGNWWGTKISRIVGSLGQPGAWSQLEKMWVESAFRAAGTAQQKKCVKNKGGTGCVKGAGGGTKRRCSCGQVGVGKERKAPTLDKKEKGRRRRKGWKGDVWG